MAAPESSILPSTMRAWIHTAAGPPSAVLTLRTIPLPAVAPAQVLVRVSHAALNPGASILMQLVPAALRRRPCIPELDFAGTVAAVGAAVPAAHGLAPGQHVFGSVPVGAHLGRGAGALAEYVALDPATVTACPQGLPLEQAAGLGVAGSTALVLLAKAGLTGGERVLVNGASGGIGTMVVQMVRKAVGAEGVVVGVCSGCNRELVLELGADEVVDYETEVHVYRYLSQQFGDAPFDVAIDCRGVQALWTHCAGFLRPRGPYVTVGPAFADYSYASMLHSLYRMATNSLQPAWLGGPPRPYAQVTGLATRDALERLARLCADGELRTVVGARWELGDARKAYEVLHSGHARGKLIVRVSGDRHDAVGTTERA